MQMPVAVGVVLAIIFLIVFSEWFYHAFIGWKEVVLDDQFFHLRIVGASIFSFLVFASSFLGVAYVTKCPSEERVGIFEKLNCDEFNKIKTQAGNILGKSENN